MSFGVHAESEWIVGKTIRNLFSLRIHSPDCTSGRKRISSRNPKVVRPDGDATRIRIGELMAAAEPFVRDPHEFDASRFDRSEIVSRRIPVEVAQRCEPRITVQPNRRCFSARDSDSRA